MDRFAEYFAFARQHAEMFQNPAEGGILILRDEQEIRDAETTVARHLKDLGLPQAWACVGIAYEDPFVVLLRDAVRFPDGTSGTYIRGSSQIKRGPGTAILPLYQDRILLLEQFRHATRRWHLEIPRGFGTQGLSSEENAQKELREEIGATARHLLPLGQVHIDTGLTSDVASLFFADLASCEGIGELSGLATLKPVSLAQFEQLIQENQITDAFTLAAFARARLRGLI